MAIYHLEAKVVSRGGGRSAVAASAYMSCSQMTNEYDGVEHDYTRKGGLVWQQVFLPDQAPRAWQDRETLWNAVEENEKTKDSRLARELVVALPIEMDHDQQIQLIQDYVKENFAEEGMCADAAIHDTDGHNPHAHILLTVRPLDKNGKWQYKSKKEYLCIRDGEEQGFTADEFQTAGDQGWEKQYQYLVDGKKTYLPPSQAQGLERVSKAPKSTRFGRQNPIAEKWNSEEQLVVWRANWAETTNRHLERMGVEARIDHRSLKDQGIERIPSIHEGVTARSMEDRNLVADRCEINRQIKASNKILREIQKQIRKLVEAAKNSLPALAEALESIREHMILLRCRIFQNDRQRHSLEQNHDRWSNALEKCEILKTELKEKIAQHKAMAAELKACSPLRFRRVKELKQQIAGIIEEIEELKTRKNFLLKTQNWEEKDLPVIQKQIRSMEASMKDLDRQNVELEARSQTDLAQYRSLEQLVPQESLPELHSLQAQLRPRHEENLHQLVKGWNKTFHPYLDILQAEKQVDHKFDPAENVKRSQIFRETPGKKIRFQNKER